MGNIYCNWEREDEKYLLKRRIIIALFSAIIFSLILSYISYTPIAEREPNSLYESFGSTLTVCFIFSVPAYLLGGIPISLYIDKFVKKEIIKLVFHLLGGFLVGISMTVISFMTVSFELLWYGVIGLFASSLFYILMLLAKKFN